MHDNGYVHRDIKLENILLSEDSSLIKLIDFGFATKLRDVCDGLLMSKLGTLPYMAPELH